MKKTSTLELKRTENLKKLAKWTVAWTLSQALVSFGSTLLWSDKPWLIILTILVNVALGLGVILINRKYLLEGDELDRKIQLESMSLALGLSIVIGLAYSSLDHTNLISFDAEISHLVIFTGLAYLSAIFINRKRYL